MVMVTSSPTHFDALDGLRGIAASTVLIGHATAMFIPPTLAPHKLLAVCFFFMLSGFVISHAYEAKLKAGMLLSDFYLRRAIRLYPMVFIGAVLGWLLKDNSDSRFFGLHFMIYAMAAIPTFAGTFPINPPEWSLFYELIGCALFPFLIKPPSKYLLCASLASCFVYFYGSLITHPVINGLLFFLAPFGIGVILARHLSVDATAPFSILSAAIVLSCCIPISASLYEPIVILFLFPLVIKLGTAARSNSLMRMLGEVSFPLYILHWPILRWLKEHFGHSPTTMFVAIAISYLLSWVILKLIDEPLRTALTRKLFRQTDGNARQIS
jgi:peptidoglycan/LPS O-acetylase OafA/YrhL